MTISNPKAHRPFKFGANDRREFIVFNSEVGVRAINNASGDPVYVGRSKSGTAETEQKWQILYVTYDANGGITSVKWPQNDLGNASTEYEFVWNDSTTTAITGITQANPGVVSMAANPFTDGDIVTFSSMVGMTELEFDSTTDTMFIVANGDATSFEITDLDGNNVNTSGYGAFTSGNVQARNWANYTYA